MTTRFTASRYFWTANHFLTVPKTPVTRIFFSKISEPDTTCSPENTYPLIRSAYRSSSSKYLARAISFFPIHMYSRFQFYAGREEFHTIIIKGIYVKYKCWSSFYSSFCYYLLLIVLRCFGFHWRSAGIISIYILNPYIIQNDTAALLLFIRCRIVLTSCQWGLYVHHCR